MASDINIARKRWRLVVDVLCKKRLQLNSDISVRRFSSFGLLKTENIGPDDVEPEHQWFRYSSQKYADFTADIRHLAGTFEAQDLLGFNNTGNVCVWPAEEVMAYYCLAHSNQFKDGRVLEIGGGMTCLAGMAVALCSDTKKVVLTDGNEKSTANLQVIIEKQKERLGNTEVKCSVLRWDDEVAVEKMAGQFDWILCADCLFFDEYREALVVALSKLLSTKGQVLIFAPTRGETFDLFEEAARSVFEVDRIERYDDDVWNLHQQNLEKGTAEYDQNIHYPLMLHLRRKAKSVEHNELLTHK